MTARRWANRRQPGLLKARARRRATRSAGALRSVLRGVGEARAVAASGGPRWASRPARRYGHNRQSRCGSDATLLRGSLTWLVDVVEEAATRDGGAPRGAGPEGGRESTTIGCYPRDPRSRGHCRARVDPGLRAMEYKTRSQTLAWMVRSLKRSNNCSQITYAHSPYPMAKYIKLRARKRNHCLRKLRQH